MADTTALDAALAELEAAVHQAADQIRGDAQMRGAELAQSAVDGATQRIQNLTVQVNEFAGRIDAPSGA
jgi:hypothetical protein